MTTFAALLLVVALMGLVPSQNVHAGEGRGGNDRWRDGWSDDRRDEDWDNERDDDASTTAATTTVATTTASTTTSTTTATSTQKEDDDDRRARQWEEWQRRQEDESQSFRSFFESIGRSFDALRRGIATTSTTTTTTSTSTISTTTPVASTVDRAASLARTIGLRSADSAASVLGTFFPTNVYDTGGFDQETTWALSLMAIGSALLGGLMVTGKVAIGTMGSLFG
jgi:hypothetical protein